MGWFLRRVKAEAEEILQREVDILREAIVGQVEALRAEARLVAERSEATVGRLLTIEAKVAAIEAISHRVSYVPVDAMKDLRKEDVDRMNVSEKVRDTLKEIVDLQDRIQSFQDLDNFEETL